MTRILLLTFIVCLTSCQLLAQDFFAARRAGWLEKANQSAVPLTTTAFQPVGVISVVKDAAAYQGWKAIKSKPLDSLYTGSFKKKSGIILDFGEHLTGRFSFSLVDIRGVADAPIRLKFTFGEVPSEVVTPFDPYEGGLSRAWLQDEIVTVTEVPSTITIPRRLSFRYVKIELLGSSRFSDFRISKVELNATTSVNTKAANLAEGTDPMIKEIDRIGLITLKECMQTVYEDGPKRDQRLWIGDLYLESLANTYSFKNHQLTKHCLYLLAALCNEKGFLNGNVFERPEPHPQANFLFDYALLYNVTVKEYLTATGDKETVLDLWDIVKKQTDLVSLYMLPDGSLDHARAMKESWVFIDWRQELDKQTSLYGVVIYALKQTYDLAKVLGREKELSAIPGQIASLTKAARSLLFDKKGGVFVSGETRQVSYASQAWMVLSGVATAKEGVAAFKALAGRTDVVMPGAPYLYHYVIEAMIPCGMTLEAKNLLVDYWGGMVKKGADTFWEVYDPKNDFLSPYNSFVINSYCHAWSCTPVYFIRKYPDIFQR
jgi:hypothetical protein